MKSIRDILPDFEKKAAAAPKGRKRQTERGELMRVLARVERLLVRARYHQDQLQSR